MAGEGFFRKYLVLTVSVILVIVLFLLSGNSQITGRFFAPSEPVIVEHGTILIYEKGLDADMNKIYLLSNSGETYLDVLMAARSPENPLEIYLPEIGWLNLPKTGSALCIANDMPPKSEISGYKIRVKEAFSGSILQSVLLTSYESNTTNPCKKPGEYLKEPVK